MKTTVTFYQFEKAFIDSGRRKSWSYEGLKALHEYFEQLEEETGTSIEFDVVAIDSEYCEYTVEDSLKDYPAFKDEDQPLDKMQGHTSVIPVSKGFEIMVVIIDG